MLRFMHPIALLALLLPSGCKIGPQEIRDTRFMMGTIVRFTVIASDEVAARNAISRAAAAMRAVEDAFRNEGAPTNAVMRLNHAPPGTPVALPEMVSGLLRQALAIQHASGNAFHVGLGRLNALWGFSHDPPPTRPPAPERIAALVPPPRCFEATPSGWVRLDARCALDFGAIAKGYAVDRGLDALEAAGIHQGIINAGGDIGILGKHRDRPWRIGVRDPRRPGGVLAALDLTGRMAVVTSGDYERFYLHDGIRYHHILDPVSGMPARRSRSSTVVAPDAAAADGWSTALFVLGPPGLARIPGDWPAMVVDAGGRIHANDAMRRMMRTP
ncbi:MAG: FAD:protein FMN transferase [Mariprofundaceae bacterium]